MKVLVTGGTGFIGKALISHLLVKEQQVKAIVRTKSEQFPSSVQQIVVSDLGSLSSSLCQDTVRKALQGVQVVVHAAARVHMMQDDSLDPLTAFRKINKDATLSLAKLAFEAGVKRFVFISSIGVNGAHSFRPFVESDEPQPHNPYTVSKSEAEQVLFKIAEQTEMETVVIRPPLVYGPNSPGNFNILLKWTYKGIPLPLGAIHNKRSLVALENLVDVIALCADIEKSPKAANQVFLISDGEDVSTTQLLQKVAKLLGKRACLIPVPVSWMTVFARLIGKKDVANRLFGSLQVDSSKAQRLLGWQPVITMDEQLKKTVESYLNSK